MFFSFILLNLTGCESFVRKFTRKSKNKEQGPELVLSPEEYKGPDMTQEELYRQYFIYWKSWQDELINSLYQRETNTKKKISCLNEAIKNLSNMKMMLVPDVQKQLDVYIARENELLSAIKGDFYGKSDEQNRKKAENLKSVIHDNFVYSKIKNYLK